MRVPGGGRGGVGGCRERARARLRERERQTGMLAVDGVLPRSGLVTVTENTSGESNVSCASPALQYPKTGS